MIWCDYIGNEKEKPLKGYRSFWPTGRRQQFTGGLF
jgi:hypothetical protein